MPTPSGAHIPLADVADVQYLRGPQMIRSEDTQLVTFLLKDPSALVRRAAVDALARLEPGTAAEPLRLALADEAATVRIAAAVALGAHLLVLLLARLRFAWTYASLATAPAAGGGLLLVVVVGTATTITFRG